MFLREKTAKGHTYLYLVESVREGSRVRQRTVHALGRKDLLLASGELTRLAEAFARDARAVVKIRVTGDLEAEYTKVMESLTEKLRPAYTRMLQIRRQKQADIDSYENYMRDTALCPEQFPRFDEEAGE